MDTVTIFPQSLIQQCEATWTFISNLQKKIAPWFVKTYNYSHLIEKASNTRTNPFNCNECFNQSAKRKGGAENLKSKNKRMHKSQMWLPSGSVGL